MMEWNLNWPGINPVSKIFSNHGNCFMNTHFINCILIRLKWSIAMLIWDVRSTGWCKVPSSLLGVTHEAV